MAEESTAYVQRFQATNGRVVGVSGLVMCAFVAVVLVVTDTPAVVVPGVVGCMFVAVLVWMALLRPGVAATRTELHLRTLFEFVRVPLASIDTAVVGRYLLIRSGGVKYICPAISRPLRRTVRKDLKWSGGTLMQPGASLEKLEAASGVQTEIQDQHDLDYPDFVEQRIMTLADADRARRGIEARSEEEYELGSQTVRQRAWPELAALAVLGVLFLVALVVF